MKNFFRFSLMLLLGVALAACSDALTEEPKVPAGGKLIQVAPTMADFTRATDTAFEQNDQIGLFVLVNEQAHIANAKFTWNGTALTADQQYYWHENEEVAAALVAYYPYNSNWSVAGTEYDFTVNADQSTHAKYTASDLMAAVATSTPTEEAVALPFKHLLSKVVITIDNQLNEAIENVWFSNVYGSMKVTLSQTVSVAANGSKGTIKAAPVTTAEGDAWALILAPQTNAEPKLIVTTASEKQYTFTLEAPVSFSAGKCSKATITLDAESIATAFTPEIEDWVSDNDLNFKQDDEAGDDDVVVPSYPEELNWNVVGDFNNWTSYDMTYSEGIYTAEPTIYAGQGFKLRLGDEWGEGVLDRGLTWNEQTQAYNTYELGVPFAVAQSGDNIVVAVSGIYTISYDVVKEMVTVVLKEQVADPEPEPEPEAGQYKVYVKGVDWSEVYIYAWDESSGTAVNFTGAWPGTLMTQTEVEGETYWVHTMPVNAENGNFQMIFNNNNGTQTGDSVSFYLNRDYFFTVNADLAIEEIVTESEYTIYAKSTEGWTNMNIWTWKEGGANYSGGYEWPGAPMTQVDLDGETYFAYTMPAAAVGQEFQVIFNNGTDQTADSTVYTLDKDYYFVATSGLVPALEGEDLGGSDDEVVTPATKSVLLCGAHNSWNTLSEEVFTYKEELGLYHYSTTLTPYSAFRLVVDGEWFGSSITNIDAGCFVGMSKEYSENLFITSGGTFDFYYDDTNVYLYVMEQDADPTKASMQTVNGADPVVDAWGLCGATINNWGNSYSDGSKKDDIKLEWDYDVEMYVAKNVAFTIAASDGGFKVRKFNDWSVNYGASEFTTMTVGVGLTLYSNAGGNLEVPAAGTYDFYFDLANTKAYLMTPGEVPSTH